MRAVDVIRKKRDGGELTADEIRAFVSAAATGTWEKYQLSALLMAIVLRGMTAEETATLTRAMTDSGKVYDLSDLPGVKVDKHCTGGVGDKVSLVLAPLAAACGVVVPMMSGRGLGHTGGTIDKLESIPGFRTDLSESEFRTALRTVGCAMIGQSDEVATADKTLYALRDVTGTVESIPLITASILSKKIAEGISALVMDVKCGRGAFMKTLPEAKALAESIQRVGTANGLRVETIITNMDVPLGRAVGHSLEVIEAIDTLKGNGPEDLTELCVLQAAMMVRLAGLAETPVGAEATVRMALETGAGLEKFRRMVEQQGGDPLVVDHRHLIDPRGTLGLLRCGPRVPKSGYVTAIDAEKVGRALLLLGGGRNKADDRIDHGVGIMVNVKPGHQLPAIGKRVFDVFVRDDAPFREVESLLESAVDYGDAPPPSQPLVLETLP